ncbi:hypothetical protein LCGC14_2966140, partial [marine sediment metagenome]
MPDPFPGGSNWPPYPRRRHIDAQTHFDHSDPYLWHNLPPAEQMGRWWLHRQGPVGDPIGPPQLTHALWQKRPMYDFPASIMAPCVGTKTEEGLWYAGQVGLKQNRSGNTVIGPPYLDLYTLYPYVNESGPQVSEAMNLADMLEADQYRFFVLFPVPPNNAWETYPCYPECVPYPEG